MSEEHAKFNQNVQSILIVDDDVNILELLAEGFKIHGLNVYKAQNGDDAWKLFKKEQIDAVLSDIRMPGMDGVELSTRIYQQSPRTKIALMTGGDNAVAKEMLDDGIVDHLFEKPFALSYVCKCMAADGQKDG